MPPLNFKPVPTALLGTLSALLVVATIVGVGALESTPPYVPPVAAAVVAYDPFAALTLTAEAAFVYDIQTDTVLYQKKAEVPVALASVTKLMLALVVAEVLRPDDIVTISSSALSQEGDSGFSDGEAWYMEDLLDLTLIASSNDGAYALGEAAGTRLNALYPGSPTGVDATIWRMNQKAQELGLTQTYFLSTNGLDASLNMAGAYGSARDMGLLLSHALQYDLDTISGTTRLRRTFSSLDGTPYTVSNTNDTLGDIPGLIAGKTGYTDLAGGNLVIAFDASIGRPVVVVVLGSTRDARFSDVERLVDAARETIGQ